MPPHEPDITQLLVSILLLGVQAGIFAFFVVIASLTYQQFRSTWRPALAFGIFIFILSLPPSILAFAHLDMGKIAPTLPPDSRSIAYVCAVVFGIAILIVCIPIRGLYLHVAAVEWSRLRGNPPTATTREMLAALAGPRTTRSLSIVVGAIIGVICAAVTQFVFHVVHVQESEAIRQMQQWFPHLEETSAWLTIPSNLGFVCSAAIFEEMIFRGGILGFLLRITKNHAGLAWLWILLVAGLWSILHVYNSDHPALKIAQIFLFGIALGYMTRRWGLLSAIAGHLGLNISAFLGAYLFPSLR